MCGSHSQSGKHVQWADRPDRGDQHRGREARRTSCKPTSSLAQDPERHGQAVGPGCGTSTKERPGAAIGSTDLRDP